MGWSVNEGSVTIFHLLTTLGPGYRSDIVFDLSKMTPYSLSDLLGPLREITDDIALYLPRTSDLRQLRTSADKNEQIKAVHYCMAGASKVLNLVILRSHNF